MSRSLPTGMAAAAAAATVAPVFLTDLDWPSGHVRAWTGYGQISYDGNTFTGTGDQGAISEIKESADGAANGVTLSLSGIPSGNIALALEDDAQGRAAKIWLAFLDFSNGTFAYGPHLIFDGFIDTAAIDDNGTTATVTIQIEKELIDRRSTGRRYTHQDQQIDHPGDMFFDMMAINAERAINWGVAASSPATATGSPPTLHGNRGGLL